MILQSFLSFAYPSFADQEQEAKLHALKSAAVRKLDTVDTYEHQANAGLHTEEAEERVQARAKPCVLATEEVMPQVAVGDKSTPSVEKPTTVVVAAGSTVPNALNVQSNE